MHVLEDLAEKLQMRLEEYEIPGKGTGCHHGLSLLTIVEVPAKAAKPKGIGCHHGLSFVSLS